MSTICLNENTSWKKVLKAYTNAYLYFMNNGILEEYGIFKQIF